MKYFIVFVFLIVCIVNASAQTEKGSFLIGGAASLQRVKVTSDEFTSPANAGFSVSPTVGYFVATNFMIGIEDNLAYSWVLNQKDKIFSNDLGTLLRYYVPFGKFAAFPQAGASFGIQNNTQRYLDQVNGTVTYGKIKNSTINYKLGAGVAWFVSKNIGIEAILSYKSSEFNADKKFTNFSSFTTNRVALDFGIQFYLPKNKEG